MLALDMSRCGMSRIYSAWFANFVDCTSSQDGKARRSKHEPMEWFSRYGLLWAVTHKHLGSS
jgi:hypothetical protein